MKKLGIFIFLFAIMVNLPAWADMISSELQYGNTYFIDKKGHKIKPPAEEEEVQEPFYVSVIKDENGLFGVQNIDGEWIIKPQFEKIANKFTNGVLSVRKNGKWGAIDNQGRLIIEPKFNNMLIFDYKYALASLDEGWGFIDTNGQWVISPLYEDALHFNNGLAAVKLDNKWGYIDELGNWFITPRFYDIVTPSKYTKVSTSDFNEGMAVVVYEVGREGYIDLKGNVVIKGDFILTDLQKFSEGLAVVKKGGKYGYINKRGQFIIKPKYIWADSFKNGSAKVIERNIRAEKKAEKDYNKQLKKQLKETAKQIEEK